MEQYISKSALVAEINKLKNISLEYGYTTEQRIIVDVGKDLILKRLLDYIDTLEVKEVDLEKDYKNKLMQKCVHKAYKRGYDVGVLKTIEKIHEEVDIDKLCKLRENIGFEFPAIASEYKKRLICYRQGIEDVLKAQKGEKV